MQRVTTLVIVVALVVTCAVVSAQPARYWGMGGAGIATANDAGAVNYNPANLGALPFAPVASGYGAGPAMWSWDIAGTIELSGDMDYKAFDFATTNGNLGIGGSWMSTDPGSDGWSLGFGTDIGETDWNWGLSLAHMMDETIFNAGFLYTMPQVNRAPVMLGLVAGDLTDELNDGIQLAIGAGIPLGDQGGVLALDATNLTGTGDVIFNAGVELPVAQNVVARAGMADLGDGSYLSLGLGYAGENWAVDVGWMEMNSPAKDELVATFSHWFD